MRDVTTRLQAFRRSGFSCTGAIDVGAFNGDWTREFWNVLPQVPILMMEPQPEPQAKLRELAQSIDGSAVIPAALSEHEGTVMFPLQDSNGGIRHSAIPAEGSISLPCTTLVAILEKWPGFTLNLPKLDLQGHELQAMLGAGATLSRFEVIICELSVIPIGGVPAFAEVNRFFEEQGCQFYDVLPQYDRPLDRALWQVDVFYVRRDSALIASTAWS